MTCIVGLVDKKNKCVIIGGDSAGTDSALNQTIRKDKKVFRCGDFVIGCTSSFRMIDILKYKFVPPPIKIKDINKYICTDFLDEVRKVFKESGFLQINQTTYETGGSFLVGYKDRLFYIGSDFQVGESYDGFNSCGCGDTLAKGSLFTTATTNWSPRQRVKKALETAEHFSAGVKGPFVFLETYSKPNGGK